MSGRGFVATEGPQQCDGCGEIKELRPYGRGGAIMCYACVKKTTSDAEVEARFRNHVLGVPLPERFANGTPR